MFAVKVEVCLTFVGGFFFPQLFKLQEDGLLLLLCAQWCSAPVPEITVVVLWSSVLQFAGLNFSQKEKKNDSLNCRLVSKPLGNLQLIHESRSKTCPRLSS